MLYSVYLQCRLVLLSGVNNMLPSVYQQVMTDDVTVSEQGPNGKEVGWEERDALFSFLLID